MTQRRVLRTGKDSDGDITSLCGAWGSTTKSTAITEIRNRTVTYYVQDSLSRRADVSVVDGATGPYLRTDANTTCVDNLDTLGDC